MVICNIANILTFVFGGPYTRGVGATLTNIISSTMISRLMLNLRDPALVRGHVGSLGGTTDDESTGLAEFSTVVSLAAVVDLPRKGSTPKSLDLIMNV